MSNNILRIIGGIWRGRKFKFPDATGLRPTSDRIRETLFNWLMNDIHETICLDVFAGSGALGLEALSRGAKQVTFIENNTKAAHALLDTISTLQCHSKAAVTTSNALQWLNRPAALAFDVVFIDPPFQQNLIPKALSALKQHQWLKPESLLYIECEATLSFDTLLNNEWEILKEKQAGEVRYGLIKPLSPN